MESKTPIMDIIKGKMTISEIREEIAEADGFISRDEETIAELQIALDGLGDIEAEILHWRVTAARERKPVDVVPLRLSQKRIEAEALRQTIEATSAVIEQNRERIAGLESDLSRQLDASLDDSWSLISAEADRIAVILLKQQEAYTATAKKLFALNALARPGKNEWFTQKTQAAFAPSFANQPRTARQQAEGLDQFGHEAFIKPTVDAAQKWRAELVEDSTAPSPFADDSFVAS